MTYLKLPTAALLALALVACARETDVDNLEAVDNDVVNVAVAGAQPPAITNHSSDATINEAEDDSENSPPTVAIPAQYRGRWGMTPADCDASRSDNKGLLRIDAQTLRFYESVASLQEQRPAIATSFAGVYSFEGEGQTWERVVTLTRTGDTLKRAQTDGTFTYQRCA